MSNQAARMRLEVRRDTQSTYLLVLYVDGTITRELEVHTLSAMGNMRRDLRDQLQGLRDLTGQGLMLDNWAVVTKAMQHLAEIGDILLLQLLGSAARERGRLQADCRGAWPGWAEAPGDAPLLEIDAPPEALFPFELLPLFDASPVQDIHDDATLRRVARRFAGYAMVVHRMLPTRIAQDSVLHGNPAMPVKMFHHTQLAAVKSEFDLLSNATNAVILAGPWPDEDLDEDQLVKVLAQYIADPTLGFDGRRASLADQIHHFSCHCDTGWPSPRRYSLELAGRSGATRSVTLGKLSAALSSLFGSESTDIAMPLVVLNACASSATNPDGATSFPELFLVNNRNRGFVGTEARVPDEVAAAFATQFYDRVLRGRPVGQALRAAKLSLLTDFRNPLGALYVYYGNPALQWKSPEE